MANAERQQNVIDLAAIAKDFGQQMLRNLKYNSANADAVDDARNQRNMKVQPSQLINMDTGGEAHYGRDHGMYCRCPRHNDPSDAVQYGWVPFVTTNNTVGAYNADLQPPNNRVYGEKAKRVLAGVKAAEKKKENAGERAKRADLIAEALKLGGFENDLENIAKTIGNRHLLSLHGLGRIAEAIGMDPKGKKAPELRQLIAEQLKQQGVKPPEPEKPKDEFGEWKRQAEHRAVKLAERRLLPGAEGWAEKLVQLKEMAAELRRGLNSGLDKKRVGVMEFVGALDDLATEGLQEFVEKELGGGKLNTMQKARFEDLKYWAGEKLRAIAAERERAEREAAEQKRQAELAKQRERDEKLGDDPREVLYDKVVDKKPLKPGQHISGAYKVTFANGFKACWKPKSEEYHQQLCREIPVDTCYKREACSFAVARLIGCDDLVVPSIERNDSFGEGSMQLWADGVEAGSVHNDREKYDGNEDLARCGVVDVLITNIDRHGGNWMVDLEHGGKLRLIDNGYTFIESNRNLAWNSRIAQEARSRGLKVPQAIVDKLKENKNFVIKEIFDRLGAKAAMAATARINAVIAAEGKTIGEIDIPKNEGW